MKSWQNHIRSGKRFIVVLTTTLLLLVTCSPAIQWLLFSSRQQAKEYVQAAKDNKQKNTEHATLQVSVNEAVIPICKFQLAFYCSFIRVFSFIKEIPVSEDVALPVPQNSYLQTLFRIIISPNAP